MAKQIIFKEDARYALKRGVDALADEIGRASCRERVFRAV